MQIVVADETRRMSEGYKASGYGATKNKHFGHVDLMNIVESMCRREEFRNLYEEDIRVRSTMFFVLSSAYCTHSISQPRTHTGSMRNAFEG